MHLSIILTLTMGLANVSGRPVAYFMKRVEVPISVTIVPNRKLSQSVVVNYSLPEFRMAVPVPVSVGYDAGPDFVERVLIDEAKKAAREVPGLLSDPEPSVRFVPGFGASSLDFTLVCHRAGNSPIRVSSCMSCTSGSSGALNRSRSIFRSRPGPFI